MSDHQLAILWFIQLRQQDRGRTPSTREIADGVGLRAGSTVDYHLYRLRARGLIAWEPQRRRTLKLTAAGFASLAGRTL
jgi:repressor LexA